MTAYRRPLSAVTLALLGALGVHPAEARGDAVALSVAPSGEPWRWDLTLTNEGASPVELLADRRLLWFDVPAPAPLAGRRARRPRRPLVCAHEARPSSQDGVARVVLAPGERFRERVDLRDLCRFRVPPAVLPASTVTVHYGFPALPRPGRPRPPSALRSVVLDPSGAQVFPELVTTATVPALPAEALGPTPHAVALRARGSSAARGEGLRLVVRLHNGTALPFQTFWRTTHFHLLVTAPDGRAIPCEVLYRQSPALRELLVRVGPGRTRSLVLTPWSYCPREAFDQAGVYLVTARFENRASGEELGLRGVFTGTLEAPSAALRVVRGDGRFRPALPRLDGGDVRTP
ncbi:MAG: hypothetical protein HY909_10485 [Deltaproteobacteria bacterium]|nr:hypothetical protein [Deltaproteobacteria bacterium]